MGGAVSAAALAWLAVAQSPSPPRRYSEIQLPPEKVHGVIPGGAKFSNLLELQQGCANTGFQMASHGHLSLEDFRLSTLEFYGSGVPVLSSYQWIEAILERKRQVAAVCPPAVLQAMLLQSERFMVQIYSFSVESSNNHAVLFSEASALNLEFNALQQWMQQQLQDQQDQQDQDGETVDDLWPLRVGWRRVQRYYDLLWQDVYDSEETWEIMESPGEISDELYHEAFNEVADVLDTLSVHGTLSGLSEWWPCRGTLIALMRHGARSGELVNGVDVVERDIDLMVGVTSEDQWHFLGRAIELELLQKGWERCWTKQSASEASGLQQQTRKDLLYCVRMRPAYMMLDITSYISGPEYIYIHRICDASSCFVPAVGPLQQANGLLPRSAIHPLQRCLAKDRPVPCPHRPLETIKAMSHSGLSPNCIALPDKALQPLHLNLNQVENVMQPVGKMPGTIQPEDVQLLRQRSADLDRKGFLSMTPYFGNCSLRKRNATDMPEGLKDMW